MNEAIKKASEVINSRKDYIGGGMEGYAVISLINEEGYPTASTVTISKAEGINWLSFIAGTNDNKANRIRANSKACVCLASSKYNITLVGTAELITQPEIKKEHWQEVYSEAFGTDHNDPDSCIIKFTSKSYNIFFEEGMLEAKGEL